MGKNKKNTQNTGGVAPLEEDIQDVGGIAPPEEDKKKAEQKQKSVRVTVRSLTGAPYRRAGIEFDAVTPRAVSLSAPQLFAIRADKNLEVLEG